jgi:hypothetical protein
VFEAESGSARGQERPINIPKDEGLLDVRETQEDPSLWPRSEQSIRTGQLLPEVSEDLE